jgi:hypothetical protein
MSCLFGAAIIKRRFSQKLSTSWAAKLFSPVALVIALVGFQNCSPSAEDSSMSSESVVKSLKLLKANPLTISSDTRVVVMEYTPWFGPHVSHFEDGEAFPVLTSDSMKKVGRAGYDSADPVVIAQHVKWMEEMGVDAVSVDVTNNTTCIYANNYAVMDPHCSAAFRVGNQRIRDNFANLYPVFAALGTSLKLIPWLSAQGPAILDPDSDGITPFEKQIVFFQKIMQQYPQLNLVYQGKPLITIFTGPGGEIDAKTQMARIFKFISARGLDAKFTFRMTTGFLDSQPAFWANPGMTPTQPVQINPANPIWSVVDRLIPSLSKFPTYNLVNNSVENFVASFAFGTPLSGYPHGGWGHADTNTYAVGAGLRGNGQIFQSFMEYAEKLKPRFLYIGQFNEFKKPDEGWDANTSNDIEPTEKWGFQSLHVARDLILKYKGRNNSAMNLAANPIAMYPMGTAQSNDELWPASNILNEDPDRTYSSKSFPTSANTRNTYLDAWLLHTPTRVNKLLLSARMVDGKASGFPRKYDIYVTSPNNSKWVFAGHFSNQPDAQGVATIDLGGYYSTYGVQIVPTVLGVDDYGRYYFQMSKVKFATDNVQLAMSSPVNGAPYQMKSTESSNKDKNDLLAVDGNNSTFYMSEMFASSKNDAGARTGKHAYLAAWLNGPQQVNTLIMNARTGAHGEPLGFPLTYDVYVTSSNNSKWEFVGHFSTPPNLKGVASLSLGATYTTYGVQIVPTTLGMDENRQFRFEMAEVALACGNETACRSSAPGPVPPKAVAPAPPKSSDPVPPIAAGSVVGIIDGIFPTNGGAYKVNGWACVSGSPLSIKVTLFMGGPAGTGTRIGVRTLAQESSKPAVAEACKSTGANYRFSMPLSAAEAKKFAGQNIYMHGISPSGGTANKLLGNSGKFTVPK